MIIRRVGKLALLAAALLLAAIVLVIALSARPHTINLEELVEVSFSGFDTVGSAYAKLDQERFGAALAKAMGKKNVEALEQGMFIACAKAVSLGLDRSEGLSNGDRVIVEISYDNDALDDYKIQYSGTSVSASAQGLTPLTEIDPFVGLEMQYSGISPNGQAELQHTGNTSFFNTQDFCLDRSTGLKNGDVITVTVPEDYDPYNVALSGYLLTQTEKTFTVEGLPEYLDTFSAIPANTLDYLQQETQDLILASAARDYGDDYDLGEISYAGYVLQVEKHGSDSQQHNRLYLVYRGVLSHIRNAFPDTMVYFPVCYSNLMMSSEGVTYGGGDEIEGETDLTDGGIFAFDTRGYTNPFTLYEDLVTTKKDELQCEAGDGMEQYDTYTPIAALSDIDERHMQLLTDRARDLITRNVESNHSSAELSNLSLVGECLLLAKTQGGNFRHHNRLIVVYQGTLSPTREDPFTAYFPVEFEGLINLPGGEFMYVRESDVRGWINFMGGRFSGNGYLDGTELFKDLVTANRSDYTYELSEGMKAFET